MISMPCLTDLNQILPHFVIVVLIDRMRLIIELDSESECFADIAIISLLILAQPQSMFQNFLNQF